MARLARWASRKRDIVCVPLDSWRSPKFYSMSFCCKCCGLSPPSSTCFFMQPIFWHQTMICNILGRSQKRRKGEALLVIVIPCFNAWPSACPCSFNETWDFIESLQRTALQCSTIMHSWSRGSACLHSVPANQNLSFRLSTNSGPLNCISVVQQNWPHLRLES